MNFPTENYKAEIMHIKSMDHGIQLKITRNRGLAQFFRKKRNSVREVKRLKEEIEGLKWFSYINAHVVEWLESELKKIEDAEKNPGQGEEKHK